MVQDQFDKANHINIREKVMSKYFSNYETYTIWPIIIDVRATHILFDISSIEYALPLCTNKARNAYIFEDREVLDRYNLRSKTRFNQVVLERWFGCCGLCRKRLDINPIPYELHHILPKRFGGKDTPNNFVPLCKAPCHKVVTTSIQRKDLASLSNFIRLGILELPADFLNFNTLSPE